MSIIYPNKESKFPRITVRHCLDQQEYVMWKYYQLQNLVITPPKARRNGGFGEFVMDFNTRSLPCLISIHDLVKKCGKRCVTQDWLNLITHPIALAAWYQDDGSITKTYNKTRTKIYGHTISISMGWKTLEQTMMIQQWLKNKWGIHTLIYSWEKENALHIHKKQEVEKFINLIKPYVECETMKYKINNSFTI